MNGLNSFSLNPTSGRRAGAALLFAMLLACVSCAPVGTGEPRSGKTDPVAAEIRALTRAPARVVWCQDIGEGSDTFAQGSTFRLMGYDTEDGRGERVILPGPSNFSRPLITPRGDRVIFSGRGDKKVFVVNWDGTGLAELADGLAVSVWRDPGNGAEWVYAGTRIGDSQTVRNLRRFRLDEPGIVEGIWDKTPIEADNVQLSADGRDAAGAFPWPECGMAEFPNAGWKVLGRGCWPAIAPDASLLLWIFDGSHRNLTMLAAGGEDRWTVSINSAPGIDGHEVYHPRWSNHAGLMVMTGPYTVGASANRIRGGGEGVEIFIGEFASDFRSIRRWARVTHNDNADFYPDLWVQPEPPARGGVPPAAPDPAPPDLEESWPGDSSGLVFLWANRAANNEVWDDNKSSTILCRVEPAGLARFGRNFDMRLLPGGWFRVMSGAGPLLNRCRENDELGIEAMLMPGRAEGGRIARIISFGRDRDEINFALFQREEKLVFRLLLGEDSGGSGGIEERELGAILPGRAVHLLISCRPGLLTCFMDGKMVFADEGVRGGFGSWRAGDLVFGDDDEEGWVGTIERVALYSRAVEKPEAALKAASCAELLAGRDPPEKLVVEAVLREASGIPAPESILPYKRALVVNTYEIKQIVEGVKAGPRILAAHWAILDGRVLDDARRSPGEVRGMTLELFDARPELEGERLVMDSDEFALPLYYDLDE